MRSDLPLASDQLRILPNHRRKNILDMNFFKNINLFKNLFAKLVLNLVVEI
jgi:hypothetical protein